MEPFLQTYREAGVFHKRKSEDGYGKSGVTDAGVNEYECGSAPQHHSAASRPSRHLCSFPWVADLSTRLTHRSPHLTHAAQKSGDVHVHVLGTWTGTNRCALIDN